MSKLSKEIGNALNELIVLPLASGTQPCPSWVIPDVIHRMEAYHGQEVSPEEVLDALLYFHPRRVVWTDRAYHVVGVLLFVVAVASVFIGANMVGSYQ